MGYIQNFGRGSIWELVAHCDMQLRYSSASTLSCCAKDLRCRLSSPCSLLVDVAW